MTSNGQEFFDYLKGRTSEIKGLVSQHLSLQWHQQCTVTDRSEWLHGDFNAYIPISVSNQRAQRLLMRCPFPHMLAGLRGSDNMDEKIRYEATTFAWVLKNCSRVPIPHLWGFTLSSGLSVSRGQISKSPLSPFSGHTYYALALIFTSFKTHKAILGLALVKATMCSLCSPPDTIFTEVGLPSC
jgi:hypothetical protein